MNKYGMDKVSIVENVRTDRKYFIVFLPSRVAQIREDFLTAYDFRFNIAVFVFSKFIAMTFIW